MDGRQNASANGVLRHLFTGDREEAGDVKGVVARVVAHLLVGVLAAHHKDREEHCRRETRQKRWKPWKLTARHNKGYYWTPLKWEFRESSVIVINRELMIFNMQFSSQSNSRYKWIRRPRQ